MNKLDLFEYIRSTNAVLTITTVMMNMLVTVLIAMFIFWVYKRTYTGVLYSRSFNITLLLTSLVTAMVMMVIGTNLALSLGMVGALSIIRFRSAIKDPRDIGFLFWGIAAGLSAGTGSYVIAAVGSLIIAIILFLFERQQAAVYPYLLVVKGERIDEGALREIVNHNVSRYSLRMKNVSQLGMEIIYEVRFQDGQEDNLLKEIRGLPDISIVNIVTYKGEIAG
jgi:uncharacterized membrane protein YhiD involved in acid resistance